MKKHVFIQLAVIFMSVIGCTKPDNGGGKDNPQPPAPPQEQITIPSTVDVTPIVPSEGGDAKITFTAATAWTASVISTKADSWVDVNPKSGNPGPAEIKITATPNDTFVERNATIQIKCGTETKDIVLMQKQLDNITVTTDKVELEAEGGSIAVEVSSNVAVTMTIPEDAGWITENKTKSVSTSTFHLDVAANDTYGARSAEITFSNEESGLSEKITVNQKGKTFIHVTSVTLNRSELTLVVNEKTTLVATVAPEDATDKSVEWNSDKPEVASVDENGVVTAKKGGTATITAKAGDKTATCIISVSQDGLNLGIGDWGDGENIGGEAE